MAKTTTAREETDAILNDPETMNAIAEGEKDAPAPALDLSALAESKVADDAPVNVPQEVKDFVDRAYDFWKSTPRKWRQVKLADEAAVAEVKKMASRFAKSVGLTFRVTAHEDSSVLKYKVTDAVRKNTADAPTDPTAGTSDSPSTSPSETGKSDG